MLSALLVPIRSFWNAPQCQLQKTRATLQYARLHQDGRCNIGEMPRKVQVKCGIAGCYRRLKLTLAEREELRRVGREHNATAGLVCPVHVKAAFNYEFDDIDVDVPLGELLVRGVQGNSPLAGDADAAAPGGGRAGQPIHASVGRQGYLAGFPESRRLGSNPVLHLSNAFVGQFPYATLRGFFQ